MTITDIQIVLTPTNHDERLLAFATVVFDGCFAVKDLRVIDGTKGLFVACPSKKLTDRCDSCGWKVRLLDRYCSDCGFALADDRTAKDEHGNPRLNPDGSRKLFTDVAHPLTSACRIMLQDAVLAEFHKVASNH